MRSRRSFLAGAAGLGLAAPTFAPNALARLMAANKAAGQASPHDLAQDEDYWSEIQRALRHRPHADQPQQRRRLPDARRTSSSR